MIRPEHPFDIRPNLRKAASTKAESTTAESDNISKKKYPLLVVVKGYFRATWSSFFIFRSTCFYLFILRSTVRARHIDCATCSADFTFRAS